jgi:heme-degrading monooxygenase HmoA
MRSTIAARCSLTCGRFRDSAERLLRRTVGAETEFVSLTFFEGLDAVRSFAGSDYETAVVAEEARKVLTRFDERVCHYQTAVEA